MFYSILLVIEVILALVLIGLVLIQQGKGADAGAAFGSGASGTVFGASGAGNFLTRMTAVLAFLFMVNSLGLAYIIAHREDPTTNTIESVIDTVDGNSSIVPADVPATIPSDVPAADTPAPGSDVPIDLPGSEADSGVPVDIPSAVDSGQEALTNAVDDLKDKASETKNELVDKVGAKKEALVDKAVEQVQPADVPE